MFMGAKQGISLDQRVRDVRATLSDLANLDNWVKGGMKPIGDLRDLTEAQVRQARANTLDAVYFNPSVNGLWLACRRQDVEQLFQGTDRVATYLAAKQGVKSIETGEKFLLRQSTNGLGFFTASGRTPNPDPDPEEEIGQSLRNLISLSKSFAVGARFFNPHPKEILPISYFATHMPQVLRSVLRSEGRDTMRFKYNSFTREGVLSLDPGGASADGARAVIFANEAGKERFEQDKIRIEDEDGATMYRGKLDYAVFSQKILAPLMREAFSRVGADKVTDSITAHSDMFAFTAPDAMEQDKFVEIFVPKI